MEANSITPEIPTTLVAGKETAGTQPPCRWNPTKEQINMLENIYKQGVRTPTAEQIQEITTKLQTFGHIEGKNVFYWFQNHKARQRQKQKQDHISYFNQYLHYHHHPHHHKVHQPAVPAAMFSVPHHPNVVYGQCYMPQSDLGFYTQYPKMILPTAPTIKRRSPWTVKPKLSAGAGKTYQETLDIFPLHPTGILQQKEATVTGGNSCGTDVFTSSLIDRSRDQLYFDFFSG